MVPYRPYNVQPASIDVTLSNRFRLFIPHDETHIDLDGPVDITEALELEPPHGSFCLHPGQFVLGSTEEVVHMPNNLVARIEGKSSLGRLGLIVHATAGFIDPGFHGRITLEMANLSPLALVLRPGKLIGQLSFHIMQSAALKPYDGRYQGDDGPAASRYGQ